MTGGNLEAQILLVSETLCPTLDDADLGIQSLHEPQGDLLLRPTVGRDAVPVPLHHGRELLERREGFPLQGVLPVGEAAPRPPVCRQERSRAGRRVW